VTVSQKQCETESRLLLINNSKSYMRFQLAPKAMTLNTIIEVLLDFFS